jgi:UDP-N-acetylglucosamine 2-epimerase
VPTQVILTGQHHDWAMMGAFLEHFELKVDQRLTLRNRSLLGSFTESLGGLGELFAAQRPSLVLAVGDTTSVIAAAYAARKTGCAFGHVESGLRAFSRELPEEEHRICADAMADLLFAPTRNALENLARERVNGTVILTGNPVLDSLRNAQAKRPKSNGNGKRQGILVTIHRQETVDDPRRLGNVLAALDQISQTFAVEWPLHPRTHAKINEFRLRLPEKVQITEPLPYREFLDRLAQAKLVITDSGGAQEEAAILGTPCVTVRHCTERVETIEAGVGLLAGTETAAITHATNQILASWADYARPVPHLYGDGHAGEKIAQACIAWLKGAAPVVESPATKHVPQLQPVAT